MATTIRPGAGMVTPAITGSTQTSNPEMERMLMQRQWELEDRKRQENMARIAQNRITTQQAAAKRDQELKAREAFNTLYGPYVNSMWDVLQGQNVGGVVYNKNNPGQAPPAGNVARYNQQGRVTWAPPTAMPEGWNTNILNNMFRMSEAKKATEGYFGPWEPAKAFAPVTSGGNRIM